MILSLTLVGMVALPSLARTQTRSELMGCVSNQRQWIQAFLLYAAENQDALLGNNWVPTNNPVDLLSCVFWPLPTRQIGSQLSAKAALESVRDGLANGPLWSYLPDAEAYHCPGDRRWLELRPGAGWGWDSYAKADGMGSGLAAGVRPFRRVAEVPRPEVSSVLIEETDPRGSNLGAWSLGVSPPGWTDVPAAMHEDGASFGFLDGHTELHRWSDAATLKAARDAMRGRQSFFFQGGTARNPDFVWVWNRYQHAGWRALP